MSEIKMGRLTLGMCQTNCYYLFREESKEAVLVDSADRGDLLFEKIKEEGLVIKGILLTHGHFDHILGCEELRSLSGAKVYAYEGEEDLCRDENLNWSKMAGRPCTIRPDVYLKDNEEITLAGIPFRVISTPGHTKGSTCYYIEEAGILLSGDTLFQMSVGRCDCPTGSMGQLLRSVKNKLLCLPDETKVFPGHGDMTTIGFERENNDFL